MPKKQPDLKQTFLQKYPAMQERVDAQNKGLTLRQSKLALYMLVYLQEREKTLSRELKNATVEADSINYWAEGLVQDWNSLTHYLGEVFSLKVWGEVNMEDRTEVWIVEYPGGKSSHETKAEAFRAGVEASLEKYKDSSNMFREAAKEWNEGKR